MRMYLGYFALRDVDPSGFCRRFDDQLFKAIREEFRAAIKKFLALSPCLLRETGLGAFLNALLATERDFATFDIGVVKLFGDLIEEITAPIPFIGPYNPVPVAGYTEGICILLGSRDPSLIDGSLLIHEMIHVYDFQNRLYLHMRLTNSNLRRVENLAYSMEHLLGVFSSLSRFEANLQGAFKEFDCERLQSEFDGIWNKMINPKFPIFVKGKELKGSVADLILASWKLNVDFSCSRIMRCLRPLTRCACILCPEENGKDDAYSVIMENEPSLL